MTEGPGEGQLGGACNRFCGTYGTLGSRGDVQDSVVSVNIGVDAVW